MQLRRNGIVVLGPRGDLFNSVLWEWASSPWALIRTISSLRESTFSSSCLFFCSTFCMDSVSDLIFASSWTRTQRRSRCYCHSPRHPPQRSRLPGRCGAGRLSAPSPSGPSSGCCRPWCSPAACCVSPWSSPLTSSCWCKDEPLWTLHQSGRCSLVAVTLGDQSWETHASHTQVPSLSEL